jgi:hypothetical protein
MGSGLVAIVEFIDPRPYNNQSPVYGRLIYTVVYMSDRLLTEANSNPRLPPPPELRSICQALAFGEAPDPHLPVPHVLHSHPRQPHA